MTKVQLIWLSIIAAIASFVYLCWGILTPFVTSLAIAYLLYPAASLLETKLGLKRWIVASLLVLLILAGILSLAAVLAPLIYEQILDFLSLAPRYKELVDDKVVHVITEHLNKIDPDYVPQIREATMKIFLGSFDSMAGWLKRMWFSSFVVIDVLWLIVLVPLITFYVVKDWSSFWRYSINLIPKNKQRSWLRVFAALDNTVSRAVRGQAIVCLALAVYYTIALSILKINYSVLLGLSTGIIAFIPFIGTLAGLSAALLVGYMQYMNIEIIIYVLGAFMLGAVLDNIFVTPLIMGRTVGAHPLWIVFSVLLGGKLFGVAGTLLAVPLSAIALVLAREIVKSYHGSKLYYVRKKLPKAHEGQLPISPRN